MKYKIILSLLLTIGILISCKNNLIQENTIDISGSLDSKSLQLLSSIADKIEYVKLQSDSSCYISRIRFPYPKIQFYNNKIFIADNTRLLAFSMDGKFITQYGNQGRGPGEYQEITDFAIFPDKDQLVLFSASTQRVLFFSTNGKFLKDMKFELLSNGFSSFNDKLIFSCSRSQRERSGFYTLSVLSEDGEIQKRLIDRKNEKNFKKIGMGVGGSHMYTLNNTLNYWDAFYDTIWTISSDFKVISRRSINVGRELIPFNYIPEGQSISIDEMKRYVSFQYYYETERYMFIELNNKGMQNHIHFDKSTGKSFNLQFKEEPVNANYLSFRNDVDGGFPFWPDGTVTGNKVFSLLYISRLKNYFSDHPDILENKSNPHNKELLNLLEQSKLEDNPILMIVTLKN